MSQREKNQNLDQEVINSFGHEWAAFDYAESDNDEALDKQFLAYCAPIGSTLSRCPDTSFLNSKVGVFPKVSLDAGLFEVLNSW